MTFLRITVSGSFSLSYIKLGCYVFLPISPPCFGAWAMANWLEALAALEKYPDLIPSSHNEQLSTTLVSEDLPPSSGFGGHCTHVVHKCAFRLPTLRQNNKQTKLLKLSMLLYLCEVRFLKFVTYFSHAFAPLAVVL